MRRSPVDALSKEDALSCLASTQLPCTQQEPHAGSPVTGSVCGAHYLWHGDRYVCTLPDPATALTTTFAGAGTKRAQPYIHVQGHAHTLRIVDT